MKLTTLERVDHYRHIDKRSGSDGKGGCFGDEYKEGTDSHQQGNPPFHLDYFWNCTVPWCALLSAQYWDWDALLKILYS